MKRVFADLHLCPRINDRSTTSQIIDKAAKLGYHQIAIPLNPRICNEEIAKLWKSFNKSEVDCATRIDLRPRNQNELTHQLRRLRRKFEVVCVACQNKAVARQAAKDRRVDLLNFPLLDFRSRYFDRAEAELASSSLAALEIDIKPLLVLKGPPRIRLLSSLRREAALAEKFDVPIVVSSGISAERLLRKPREMAALASLFGLDEDSALKAVSHSPNAIIKRNREKLDAKFVGPGIRVVKEGKDC